MNAAIHLRPAAEHASSYYAATLNEETDYSTLLDVVTVGIAITGGGFTGVVTAVELVGCGCKVALIETYCIGWDASGRNDGQITGSLSGDAAIHKQMRQWLGAEVEDFTWHLCWRGHEIIRQRVEKYGIAYDLRHGHLHVAIKASHMDKLQAFYEEAVRRGMGDQVLLLDKAGVQAHLETELYCGTLKNTHNMHPHSFNLCVGEARAAVGFGALIFEHPEVLDIVHGPRPVVIAREGRIEVQQILPAGNIYHKLERRQLKGMIFPAMGGTVTTRPLGELAREINLQGLAVYDCRFVLDYYCLTVDGRLLFGGGASYPGRGSRDIAVELRPCIERTFPRLKGVEIEFQWSCAMGIVMSCVPQLGKLSDSARYCQGYSGYGVATSHIMDEIMAKAMSGSLEQFDIFARYKHFKVLPGDLFDNPMLAAGMWCYQLMEKSR